MAPLLAGFLFACTAAVEPVATADSAVKTSPIHPLTCGPNSYFQKWEERLLAGTTTTVSRGELRGENLKLVLDAFNGIEPVTDIKADRAFTYLRPGSRVAVLAFVLGDCVVVAGNIELGQLMMWLRDVKGKSLPLAGSVET